jgi:hypothetical protein
VASSITLPSSTPRKTSLTTLKRQNFIIGVLLGLTGGLYVALNLLGAGGGKPNSASTINTANALLCAVYAVSSLLGGTVLNRLGPAWTAFVSAPPPPGKSQHHKLLVN